VTASTVAAAVPAAAPRGPLHWFARAAGAATPRARCAACAHLRSDAAGFEAASPGLAALSSAYGAVLGGDGLCAAHSRYVSPDARCSRFLAQMR